MHVASLPPARIAAKNEVRAASRVVDELVSVTQAWWLRASGSDLLNLSPARRGPFAHRHTRELSNMLTIIQTTSCIARVRSLLQLLGQDPDLL